MGNLVLRRRAGESLVLFDDAGAEMGRVTVAAVGTERVKLALAFRGDVTIMREELVAQDRAETTTATATATHDQWRRHGALRDGRRDDERRHHHRDRR